MQLASDQDGEKETDILESNAEASKESVDVTTQADDEAVASTEQPDNKETSQHLQKEATAGIYFFYYCYIAVHS